MKMALTKRFILIIHFVLLSTMIFSQKNSLNGGFDLLGIKSSGPYGGGFHLGYELSIPKINFLAVEIRIAAGVLGNDGLYKTTPIEEWYYEANYLRGGICPRLYFKLADDIELFLDTEFGLARLSGKTYFSEQEKWNPTKTLDYNYYVLRVGSAIPLNDKLKLSIAFGYSSMDLTKLLNSRVPTINYHFRNQPVNIETSITLHVVL